MNPRFGQKYNNNNTNQGRPQGEGEASPPETERIVVEKWCYFPELYKMTKVREDGIENG